MEGFPRGSGYQKSLCLIPSPPPQSLSLSLSLSPFSSFLLSSLSSPHPHPAQPQALSYLWFPIPNPRAHPSRLSLFLTPHLYPPSPSSSGFWLSDLTPRSFPIPRVPALILFPISPTARFRVPGPGLLPTPPLIWSPLSFPLPVSSPGSHFPPSFSRLTFIPPPPPPSYRPPLTALSIFRSLPSYPFPTPPPISGPHPCLSVTQFVELSLL